VNKKPQLSTIVSLFNTGVWRSRPREERCTSSAPGPSEPDLRWRVLGSTISNYVGKIVGLGTWFFLTPFILHRLGPVNYGMWALVGSIVAYGSLLDLGITGAVIKYVAEYRAKGQIARARNLVATALWLYSALGFVTILVSAAFAPAFPHIFNVPPDERLTASHLVLLLGVGIGLSIPCTAPISVLKGLQRFDLANAVSVTGVLLSATGIAAVLLLDGGVLGMATVGIIVTILMPLPSIWLIKRIAPELQFGWRGGSRQLVRPVLSFASSLFLMNIAGHLQTRTGGMVIGAFLPLSAVTPYAIAGRLSEVAQILTDQFMKVILPLASALNAADDRTRMRSLYITSTRLTLAVIMPVACILIVLARPILSVWVGPEYEGYAHLIVILTCASSIDASQWPAGALLQGMARHRPLAWMWFGAALANIALSIALVTHFGVTGVAFGTLLPTIVICLGLILPYTMRVIGVTTTQLVMEIVSPVLLPAIPMTAVLYVLRRAIEPSSMLSIMFLAAISFLIYLIAYLSWGGTEVERQTCRDFALGTIRFAETCLKRT
jgi:O-antigen/teichoic acid export membrane protein